MLARGSVLEGLRKVYVLVQHIRLYLAGKCQMNLTNVGLESDFPEARYCWEYEVRSSSPI